MYKKAVAIILTLVSCSFGAITLAASGSNLSIVVKDERGIPVSDAVVMVYPASMTGKTPRFGPTSMAQKNFAFVPGTLIVARGASVSFPNFDRVRHSIYSFSKAARFEINLYGKDQSRSQLFPISGTVAIGCNIHDQMRGYIKVVDTPFAAKTDRNGVLELAGLPSGAATVKIWHPQVKSASNETAYKASLSVGRNERSFILAIRRN